MSGSSEGAVEVQLYSLTISSLKGGRQSTPRPGRFNASKKTLYPFRGGYPNISRVVKVITL